MVHEWGVTIRGLTTAGAELGPPRELIAGLPRFALRHDKAYKPEAVLIWDKPVVHLYGSDGMNVEVTVMTPEGRPLAYFPKPEFVQDRCSGRRTWPQDRRQWKVAGC